MSALPPLDQEELIRRINRDLADSYDEELEMEIEDRDFVPPEQKARKGSNGDGGEAPAMPLHGKRADSDVGSCA